MVIRMKSTAVVLVALASALSACGSGGGSRSEGSGVAAPADQGATGGDGGAGVDSTLDIAGKSIVTVQSQKYEDYEVDGDVVRLAVRDGKELDGSECLIIDSATGADHPEAKWVLVEADGTETAC
jgi:hypothetical protein